MISAMSESSDETSLRPEIDETFPVMGVTGRIVAVGATLAIVEAARRRLEQLESRWSRFRPDSDLSRLNNAGGGWTAVSPDTVRLLRFMERAHAATRGAFNPAVLPATMELGDTRSRTTGSTSTIDRRARLQPELSGLEIDESISGARIPPTMALDAGGIGKGLAADIVAEELVAAGAAGACINLGGDLRCTGESPADDGWKVDILDAHEHSRIVSTVWLTTGAVATSTVAARTWEDGSTPRHHIIDPGTGSPTPVGAEFLELASVIAAQCAWAEVFTKALLVRGWHAAVPLMEPLGLAALGVDGGGHRHETASWKSYLG